MSWTTGTQTETLGANNAVGAALTASATPTVISPSTGAAYLPTNFFLPSYGIGKSLLVKASGAVTITAANLTLAVQASTALGTALGSGLVTGTTGILASTNAVAGVTATNAPWELECLITCVTTGSAATFLASGSLKIYTTSTTWQNFRVGSTQSNPNTTATIGASGTVLNGGYYIELSANWSTTSQSITCYSYICLGLN